MMTAKMNMKSNPKFAEKLWKCDRCQRLDAQSHILWCSFFAPLGEVKEVKDEKDLVNYFEKVFKIPKDLKSEDGSSLSFPGSDKSCRVYIIVFLCPC
jgi:hypothetical protein